MCRHTQNEGKWIRRTHYPFGYGMDTQMGRQLRFKIMKSIWKFMIWVWPKKLVNLFKYTWRFGLYIILLILLYTYTSVLLESHFIPLCEKYNYISSYSSVEFIKHLCTRSLCNRLEFKKFLKAEYIHIFYLQRSHTLIPLPNFSESTVSLVIQNRSLGILWII